MIVVEEFWSELNSLISEDVTKRGISRFAQAEELRKAVEAILKAKKIAIFTGFVILPGVRCETDGLLGAIFLSEGLMKLGKEVSLWTDSPHAMALKAGLRSLDSDIPVFVVPFSFGGGFFSSFWQDGYDLLISVERPGKAIDGRYYSFRGIDLSFYVSPLDEFFMEARRRGVSTVGIGDGGNEIGMGKIRELLVKFFPNSRKIFSVVKTDHLVVSAVSNWGAYALLAGLSIMSKVKDILPEDRAEEELLKVVVDAGSVDGILLTETQSVDGLGLEVLGRKLKEIKSCLEKFSS